MELAFCPAEKHMLTVYYPRESRFYNPIESKKPPIITHKSKNVKINIDYHMNLVYHYLVFHDHVLRASVLLCKVLFHKELVP